MKVIPVKDLREGDVIGITMDVKARVSEVRETDGTISVKYELITPAKLYGSMGYSNHVSVAIYD